MGSLSHLSAAACGAFKGPPTKSPLVKRINQQASVYLHSIRKIPNASVDADTDTPRLTELAQRCYFGCEKVKVLARRRKEEK